jgi:hypothetical protein
MRKFAFILTTLLFKLALVSLALTGAVTMSFSSSETLKDSAADSGLYDGAVDTALDIAADEAEKQSQDISGNIDLDHPEVREAANKALPPDRVKDAAEEFIDGMYLWLNGESDQPIFSIDLSESKSIFINELANRAVERFEALPVCTFQQLRSLDPDMDPLDAPCRPPNVSSAKVRNDVVNELENNELIRDPVITPEKFTQGQDEQLFSDFEHIRTGFQGVGMLPWILGPLAGLLAVLLIALHKTRRRGIRSVAIIMAGAGVFILVSSLVVSYLSGGVRLNPDTPDNISAPLTAIIRSLSDIYAGSLLRFGASYLLIGVGLGIALWIYGRRNGGGTNTAK